jgi:hypothetical protein
VYRCGERVLRGLSAEALANFRALGGTRFYQRALEAGQVIASRELAASDNPLPAAVQEQWAGFLEHTPVPVVSYPYEWPFSMLRQAADLQLELLDGALEENWTIKDASPYNLQFVDGRPVFIDLPSFQPLESGEPWVGRRQFCTLFLFPLMLQAYKGVDFQPFLRAAIDGIDVQTMDALCSWRDRLRRGVLSNVWLQAVLERRYGGTRSDIRGGLKAAGFNRDMIRANVRALRKVVARLEWTRPRSEWGGYAAFHNYSEEDLGRKAAFVERSVQAAQPGMVWDLGGNTGQFSIIAARSGARVVCTDIDHLAVEQLALNPQRPARVLPLVQDVTNPSPNWGWRNRERLDLVARSQPDMVLCLALIHHVVITANVPLGEFVEWLAGLAPNLVIEYVSRRDEKVQTLLRNKEDRYWDYRREFLEEQLRRHYLVVDETAVRGGARRLYYCTRRAPGEPDSD